MATREETISAFKGVLGKFQPKLPYYPGYMGDGAGAVYTARENYYWVRYPLNNSPAVPVYCIAANVAYVDGYRVIVGYLPEQPNLLQVIRPFDARVDGVSATDTEVRPGSTSGYVAMASHNVNHRYLSTDPVYINWRQITPLAVYPSSGLVVQIRSGYIPRPGGDVFVANQTLDLTSHVPVSGARYVLISYDSTGAVVVTDGAINAGGFSALTAADIPATPAGNWRTCAVVLYAGQTAIVETTSEIDFWDLRFPEQIPAGTVSPSSIPLANTHILVGNASNIATDVAMSNDATMANTGALTIANAAVTYAKMQNVSATQRALGRNTAGAGSVEEVTASQIADWIGNTRGSILYRGASGWSILAPGTSGYVLTSNGAGADPTYQQVISGAINVYNETIGADGISTIYHLVNVANPGTIRVYVNGIRQPATDDVVATDIVTFTSAPALGALLLFDYEMEIV